jgi:hypothetical protein
LDSPARDRQGAREKQYINQLIKNAEPSPIWLTASSRVGGRVREETNLLADELSTRLKLFARIRMEARHLRAAPGGCEPGFDPLLNSKKWHPTGL